MQYLFFTQQCFKLVYSERGPECGNTWTWQENRSPVKEISNHKIADYDILTNISFGKGKHVIKLPCYTTINKIRVILYLKAFFY